MEVRGQVDMPAAVTSATAEYKPGGGGGLGFGRSGREEETIKYSCREWKLCHAPR
jgi:hypothetical protein